MNKQEELLISYYNRHPKYISSIRKIELLLKVSQQSGVDFTNKSFLDIGCGDGRVCLMINSLFNNCKFTGIDISKNRIGIASEVLPNHNFICSDLYSYLKVNKLHFDIGLMFEVIEHLNNPYDVLNELISKTDLVIGSVPINCYGISHIQLFHTEKEFLKAFPVQKLFRWQKYLFFKATK